MLISGCSTGRPLTTLHMDGFTIGNALIQTMGMAGHYWYAELDSKVIRKFVDNAFPGLATDPIADCLDGRWHRWKEGHDLLTDVLPRITTDPGGALHQAGHILLTDFPTVDGIPIPGLSANGIGPQVLDSFKDIRSQLQNDPLGIGPHILDLFKSHDINSGLLCINIDEALQGGIGIMAVSESHSDLIAAMNGGTLDGWTAFDTFGEGVIELEAGLHLHELILTASTGITIYNPLLVAAAIENVVSGVIRTFNTIQLAIDDMFTSIEEFFGAVLGGSIIGIGISLFLSRKQSTSQRIQRALFTGARAAILGGAGVISPFLSMGLAAGFCFHELCKSIISGEAKVHEYKPGIFRVSLESCMTSPTFKAVWEAYTTQQRELEQHLNRQLVSIRKELEKQKNAIKKSCPAPLEAQEIHDFDETQQQGIELCLEKQYTAIRTGLEKQEEATRNSMRLVTSSIQLNEKSPIPVDNTSGSIESMLNKQRDEIEQLINRSTTY